jgi:hypothetical protein
LCGGGGCCCFLLSCCRIVRAETSWCRGPLLEPCWGALLCLVAPGVALAGSMVCAAWLPGSSMAACGTLVHTAALAAGVAPLWDASALVVLGAEAWPWSGFRGGRGRGCSTGCCRGCEPG